MSPRARVRCIKDTAGRAIPPDGGPTGSVETPAATGIDSVDPDVVKVEDGSYRLYYKHHSAFRAATSPDGFAYPSSGEAGRTALGPPERFGPRLLYTSDAADERSRADLGGRRLIEKKKKTPNTTTPSNHTTNQVTTSQALAMLRRS